VHEGEGKEGGRGERGGGWGGVGGGGGGGLFLHLPFLAFHLLREKKGDEKNSREKEEKKCKPVAYTLCALLSIPILLIW
jgi:hypothetical protein